MLTWMLLIFNYSYLKAPSTRMNSWRTGRMRPNRGARADESIAIEAAKFTADEANQLRKAMATFRHTHYGWAHEYINKWEKHPRGTGGTPYMTWLRQMVDETRTHKLPA